MIVPTRSAKFHESANTDTREICALLQTNAGRYFNELDGEVRVDLRWSRRRKMSMLFEFDLSDAVRCRTVMVKVTRPRGERIRLAKAARGIVYQRPGLAPRVSRSDSVQMEFDALRAIEKHFAAVDDDRFLCVRALEALPSQTTLVTEKLPMDALKDVLSTRGAADDDRDILQAFRNAGRWLHEMHQMPPLAHAQVGQTTRSEFLASVQQYADFLTRAIGKKRFFRSIVEQVQRAAHQHLPSELPVGLMHGDFGARNVLADAEGRVAGIDTRARSHAAIYEDISYFLVMLRSDSPKLYGGPSSCSTRRIEQAGDEFLAAYFGDDPVPREAIRLFEIQAVMEKWTPYALGYCEASGLRKLAKLGRLKIVGRFFTSNLRRLSRSLPS